MTDYSFSDACERLKLSPWEVARACIEKNMPYQINGHRVMIPLEDIVAPKRGTAMRPALDSPPITGLNPAPCLLAVPMPVLSQQPLQALEQPIASPLLLSGTAPLGHEASPTLPTPTPTPTILPVLITLPSSTTPIQQPDVRVPEYPTTAQEPPSSSETAPAYSPAMTPIQSVALPTNPLEALLTTPDSPPDSGTQASQPNGVSKKTISAYKAASQSPSDTKKTFLNPGLRTLLQQRNWDPDLVEAVYLGFSKNGFSRPQNYEQHVRGRINQRVPGREREVKKVVKKLLDIGAIVENSVGAYKLNNVLVKITDLAVREYVKAFNPDVTVK